MGDEGRFFGPRVSGALIALVLCACVATWAPATASARLGFVPNINGNPDTVSTFDTVSLSEVGTPIALEPGSNANPMAVAVAPDGSHAYVVNTNSVSVIDVATRMASGSPVPAGSGASDIAITPDGASAYVVNGTPAGSVTRIALATNTSAAPVPLGANTYSRAIAITPDGTRAYVANAGPLGNMSADTVAVIDLTTNTLTGPAITVGDAPSAIAITPDGSRAYVVNSGSQTISVIDTATNATTGTPIPVPAASAIAIAPDGSHAYVVHGVNPGSGIAVIDTASNTVTGNVPMDPQLNRIAISPDGSRGFVAGGNSNRVRAFDTATNTPVGSPIGPTTQGAVAIAITPDQGPAAAFTVPSASAGAPTTFDATGSSDVDGTVARYDWDFGDGTTLADGGPTPTHTYAAPGTYTATLTVTDNEGCSTRFVFTGQTASCNAGGSARTQGDVVVADARDTDPPDLTLGGHKKQKLGGAVLVPASCGEACTAVAVGTLVVKTPAQAGGKSSGRKRFKLTGSTAPIAASQTLTLKLTLPFHARLAARKALAAGGKANAKVTVAATDKAGNSAEGHRKITLRAKH